MMCAETAFVSLDLPWLAGRLDAQAVAALRASGASFTATLLQQAVAASVSATSAAVDVLLLFSVHDVVFDAADQCHVRVGVRVALGSLLTVPKEPGLVHGLSPGEAIERVGDGVSRIGQALLVASRALTPQPLAMRTLSGAGPGMLTDRVGLELRRGAAYSGDWTGASTWVIAALSRSRLGSAAVYWKSPPLSRPPAIDPRRPSASQRM